ncbi:MAG: iron ABC transporter permease [Prevotellaceae bacterium]|nr:iron ABC transporter permease [Candidatus Minthosoma caballi]
MKLSLSLSICIIILFLLNILLGSVSIPASDVFNALTGQPVEKESWRYIVVESRLPQAVTALLCGASLAAAGLMLQTSFRNPLAGPSILGITNGASLGVALVLLAGGGVLGATDSAFHLGGFFAVICGAFIGALLVMGILLGASTVIKSNIMLLIVGIMVGYLTTSVISLLNFFASADNVHSYVMWGMGSFSDVSLQQLPWFSGVCVVGLTLSILLVKPLNALLLGDDYARNLGINIQQTRSLLLLATGLLTAIVTAFCGPIAFIGLSVPHIARMFTSSDNHKLLLPATILMGSVVALVCNLICITPANTVIPLNAVTPIIGAPVILYVIICKRR